MVERAKQGAAFDADQAARTCSAVGAGVMFDDLSVEKPGADLPLVCLPSHRLGPTAKVRSERVEIQLQAIAGDICPGGRCQGSRQAIRS